MRLRLLSSRTVYPVDVELLRLREAQDALDGVQVARQVFLVGQEVVDRRFEELQGDLGVQGSLVVARLHDASVHYLRETIVVF